MTTNFESYLLGLYNNKKQAQSSPTLYSQVFISWSKSEDGFYHSKQWYRSDGEDNPYRVGNHKLVEVSDTEVIMENYASDFTRREACDMIFTYDGQAWHGTLIGDGCIIRGNAKVTSEIHLTKDGLESRDIGHDVETGEKVFGGTDMYRFQRGRLAQR